MYTAQEAYEMSTRASDIVREMELNRAVALVEEKIKESVNNGKFFCCVSTKMTDSLHTDKQKVYFKQRIIQTFTKQGYKVICMDSSNGSDDTFFYDFMISWEDAKNEYNIS